MGRRQYNGSLKDADLHIQAGLGQAAFVKDLHSSKRFLNPLHTQDTDHHALQLKTQSVPRSKHCKYIVTLRRVRSTAVAVGKQYVFHIVSVCL